MAICKLKSSIFWPFLEWKIGAEVVDVEEATAEPTVDARLGGKRKRNDSEGSEDEDWEDVIHSSDDEEAGEGNGDNVETNFLTLEEKAKKAAEVTANR